MEYTFKPSLKHRALVAIAGTMWTQHKIIFSSTSWHSTYYKYRTEWHVIMENVVNGVFRLGLVDEICVANVVDIIKATGVRILAWISLQDYYGFSAELPRRFCWTPQGTVDLKNTAKLLLQNDTEFDAESRFRLACTYCLVDDIETLWEPVSINLLGSSLDELMQKEKPVVVFWIYNQMRKHKPGKNISDEQSAANIREAAFRHAATNGNEAAFRYFLQNLTIEETEVMQCVDILARTIYCNLSSGMNRTVHRNDVLYFLLATMNSQLRTQVIRQYLCEILICLIEYPWVDVFIEMSEREWANLSEEKYKDVLFRVALKTRGDRTECDYENLFDAFWLMSSPSYKNYVLDDCVKLLAIRYPSDGKKEVSHEDIAKFEVQSEILLSLTEAICEKLARSKKWDLLSSFTEQFLPTKRLPIILKKEITDYIRTTLAEEGLSDKYPRLREIPNESEYSDMSEDETADEYLIVSEDIADEYEVSEDIADEYEVSEDIADEYEVSEDIADEYEDSEDIADENEVSGDPYMSE